MRGHGQQNWEAAVIKIIFDRKGRAAKVTLLTSSGDRARDAQCLAHGRRMTLPLPHQSSRVTRAISQYRVLRVAADVDLPPAD